MYTVIGNVVKIAIGAGVGIAAIAKRNTIKNVAIKVKDAVVDFFSGPDYSTRRAPHIVINNLDTVEDYVKLEYNENHKETIDLVDSNIFCCQLHNGHVFTV